MKEVEVRFRLSASGGYNLFGSIKVFDVKQSLKDEVWNFVKGLDLKGKPLIEHEVGIAIYQKEDEENGKWYSITNLPDDFPIKDKQVYSISPRMKFKK
jgi:hypothetical protein